MDSIDKSTISLYNQNKYGTCREYHPGTVRGITGPGTNYYREVNDGYLHYDDNIDR